VRDVDREPVTATDVGCPPPTGFQILSGSQMPENGTYWDIDADPPITEPPPPQIRICLHYAQIIHTPTGPVPMPEGGTYEQNIRIVHGTSTACDGTGWTMLSGQTRDMAANEVCGYTGSLSPFAIVTPTDTKAPRLRHVREMVVAFSKSQAGVKVDYQVPTALDAFDGPVPVTCSPASGSTFPVGKTTVRCAASDLAGNTATDTFTVWVKCR
jgi:hypothetical protein